MYYCNIAVSNSTAAEADTAADTDNNTAAGNNYIAAAVSDYYTAAAAADNCTAAAGSCMAADCNSGRGPGLSDTSAEQGRIADFVHPR